MEHRRRATVDLAALAEPVERAAMLVLAALAAVVVPGRAATVVWVRRASAALVAMAVQAAPGSMRAVSTTVRMVVMPGRAVLVERAALLARLARTRRPWLAGLAGPAVMPARRVRVRRVLAAWMEFLGRAAAVQVALVELAARAAMLVLAALAALVVAGRAVAVVWGRRALAALEAVAARVALGSMRAVSATAQQVVMPARVALVERAVQLARLARTLRRCLAVLAVPAVTLARRVRARLVSAARVEHSYLLTALRAARAEPVALAAMQELAALVAVVLLDRAATVVWAWRAAAALVAVAALAAPGSMRAASTTVRQVVMPGRAALVERVVQLARLARTLRRCLAVLAEPAVTLA